MADHKIGGLPVVRDSELIGIITETDLFKIFLEMLGAREPGVRIVVLVRNTPGELTELTRAVFEAGGNIVALGTFLGESSENRVVTIKAAGVDGKSLTAKIGPLVERVIDFRESW
jgi:acetoin utilization protein AcuB